jgi:hypothetical protein
MKPPSQSAKSTKYMFHQQDHPIYNGWYSKAKPMDTTVPLIQLFYPIFSHFLDDLKNKSSVPVEVSRMTVRYMRAASGIYNSEEARRHAVEDPFSHIIGIPIARIVNSDKMSSDSVMEVQLSFDAQGILKLAALVLKEDKREFGDGGSDPSMQCGLSITRYWAQYEVHNMLLFSCLQPSACFHFSTRWCAITPAAQCFFLQMLAHGLQSSEPSSLIG